jgi:hypothetical protein
MKYICYIGVLFLLFSGVFFYTHSPKKPPPEEDIALRINDRVITREEFEELRKKRYTGELTEKELLNSIIEKELLIQEAKRLGIDREEPFRRSIQNFYEQSLIKILLERKLRTFDTAVKQEEIEAYRKLAGKRLNLTFITGATLEDFSKGNLKKEKKEVAFTDLSRQIQFLLIGLKEGESSKPVLLGRRYLSIRIDSLADLENPPESLPSDTVREIIKRARKEILLSSWIGRLRESADIQIRVGSTGREGGQ